MIQMLSRLEVADNTGARRVRMIRRLGQLTDTAGVGDIIICSVKDSTPDAQVKKGSVCRAVIVRRNRPIAVPFSGAGRRRPLCARIAARSRSSVSSASSTDAIQSAAVVVPLSQLVGVSSVNSGGSAPQVEAVGSLS